jgi:threonine dehydratase
VQLTDVGLFSDGTAVKLVGEETFRVARALVDDFVWSTPTRSAPPSRTCSRTRAASWSRGRAGRGGHQAVRGAAQAQGPDLVAITCGANMNFDRLRFVAERAEFGEQREALFAVTIPEERGSFKRFCELIGPRSVTEFNYRISDERWRMSSSAWRSSKRDEAERIERTSCARASPPST